MAGAAYLRTFGLATVLLAAAAGGYVVFFRDDASLRAAAPVPPAPLELPTTVPVAPPVPAPIAPAFVIAEVDGVVEVRRNGTWAPVAAGDTITQTEAIKTAALGHATLRSGEGDELVLQPRVELEVGALGRTVTELTLTRGKVRAAPAAGSERFQITSYGARTSAPGGARFTVFADARGAVTVASEDGEVKVLAREREVTLHPREETYVAPGNPPAAPTVIPDAVFVTVAWPEGELHAKSATLRGRARPGTQVSVNGEDAPVAADGTFVAQVPLANGKNPVRVVAEAMDGKKAERSGSVQADTKGPPLEADPTQLYAPKPASPSPSPSPSPKQP
jgi:hypothetical protein